LHRRRTTLLCHPSWQIMVVGLGTLMRIRVIAKAFVGTTLLTACASSTGILPAGPDTYTITEKFAPIRGGGDEAERDALTKANDYCSQQGRQFVPSTMGQAAPVGQYGPTGYSVTFKCLLPNDPAIAKYQLQPAPNVIVEQRNR
jgi:hypothetical protein